MSVTNFPNGVSSFGMPMIGMTTGSVFFVDDSGSNGNSGADTDNPFADIDYAIGQCTASKGDVIFVMPGHYEAITGAAAIDCDVAGVSIIGLGRGTDQPQISFGHADAGFVIGAASVWIENINFQAAITGVLLGVSVEAAGDYFTIKNCRFDVATTTTDEFMSAIEMATTADYGIIDGNYIDMGLGGATQAVHLNNVSTGHQITNNSILGAYSTAVIAGSTAASTVLYIGNNILSNGSGTTVTAQPAIEMNGNTSAMIYDNLLLCNQDKLSEPVVCDYGLLFENYYNETVDAATTGVVVGGTASADG
jgi:hypothetical protein